MIYQFHTRSRKGAVFGESMGERKKTNTNTPIHTYLNVNTYKQTHTHTLANTHKGYRNTHTHILSHTTSHKHYSQTKTQLHIYTIYMTQTHH